MSYTESIDTAVWRSRDRAGCEELWLVLDAAGIPARVVRGGGGWSLAVAAASASAARREIDEYRNEAERRSPPPVGSLPGGAAGAAAYVAVLIGTAALARRGAFGAEWLTAGRLDAGLVVEGEWWRTVTALTLHGDAAHLVANLAFGVVFGLLLAQALGGGLTWLAVLVGGAAGNALDGWLQPARHAAIGASTAVFAALGLLLALSFPRRDPAPSGKMRLLSPLIAGFLLLVYTGMGGERTDVLAHLTGLVCGALVGLPLRRIPRDRLARSRVQLASASLAALFVLAAWYVALAA
ncbi:MAG TPA: rhomboid family intramembrane serine protease [Candidatus Polarisedimenticolaceae bacterium]|nr:rhomboid family intramembrane serine protease [Candidatus Polarisedimenticolaceae bacterium]